MTEVQKDLPTQVALFRYGLIADLLHAEAGQSLNERLRDKAARSHTIPGTHRTRVAVETLRDWLHAYREGGFDALKPKPRADRGRSRAIPGPVADALVMLKDEHPDMTVAQVIEAVRDVAFDDGTEVPRDLPLSTVHRLLRRAGVMDKPKDAPTDKDKRRFAFERAGQLWMGDVMHGPAVYDGDKKRKTYLFALIDDATRLVPFAAFCHHENTAAILPVLKQAILRRGVPERFYVDNGAAFRSHHLSLVCAKVGITLIHARPYQPAGKGKIERFFRTTRTQLLPRLSDADYRSLEAINRRLWAWVEGEYHQRPHKGLGGKTPLDAWAAAAHGVRTVPPELDLREAFLFEQKRKVQRDRTVSLQGAVYEVDPALVGMTVTLRFDPADKKGSPVDIWHDGKRVQTARLVDGYANCFVKRHHDTKVLIPSVGPDAPQKGLDMRRMHPDNKKGVR